MQKEEFHIKLEAKPLKKAICELTESMPARICSGNGILR